MAIPKTVKLLVGCHDGETDSSAIVRKLYDAIAQEYGSQVRQAIIDDQPGEHFFAVTDCGWWRLDLMAWSIGHPGVSKYVLRERDIDDDETWTSYLQLLP